MEAGTLVVAEENSVLPWARSDIWELGEKRTPVASLREVGTTKESESTVTRPPAERTGRAGN